MGWNHARSSSSVALISHTVFEDTLQGRNDDETLARAASSATDGGAVRFLWGGHARVEHSLFRRNVGGIGGAAIGYAGDGSLDALSSLFEENFAFGNGGAINFRGAGGFNMRDSIFERNYIASPPGTLIPLYVRIFTGSMGMTLLGCQSSEMLDEQCYFGNASETLPVWKIDGEAPLTGCNDAPETLYFNPTPLEYCYTARDENTFPHLPWMRETACMQPAVQSHCVDGTHPAYEDGTEKVFGSGLSDVRQFVLC